MIVTREGRVAPLECNPRAVSGIHLFDAAPALARAIPEGTPAPAPSPGTIRHLAPAMVLLGLPAALAASALTHWRHVWRCGQDAVGRPGDRLPVAGVCIDAARFALLGIARGRSPTGETTDDIEWNGEAIL